MTILKMVQFTIYTAESKNIVPLLSACMWTLSSVSFGGGTRHENQFYITLFESFKRLFFYFTDNKKINGLSVLKGLFVLAMSTLRTSSSPRSEGQKPCMYILLTCLNKNLSARQYPAGLKCIPYVHSPYPCSESPVILHNSIV